jgi:hypothetical protein
LQTSFRNIVATIGMIAVVNNINGLILTDPFSYLIFCAFFETKNVCVKCA